MTRRAVIYTELLAWVIGAAIAINVAVRVVA